MSRPLGPATPVFRGNARNPYDVVALSARFGSSWAGLVNENPSLDAAPIAGFRYLMGLSDARVDVLLSFRSWRNGR